MAKIWLSFFLALALSASASAEDISGTGCVTTATGIGNVDGLFDMELLATQRTAPDASITLESEHGIASVYFIFDEPCQEVTLTQGVHHLAVPLHGMLHAFVDVEAILGEIPDHLTLTFSSGEAKINELRIFSAGALPDWVQQWERIPQGEADLLLLSTHGDDEQLFFAGLLPWYAAEKGLRTQVVYFTDHRNLTPSRVHEMLDGLWAVGVRDYPVFGCFPDYYTFSREDAVSYYASQGYSKEALLSFVVENLRYYRPLVAVGHDEQGEYGHGMHQLTAQLLKEAVEVSAQPDVFADCAENYGIWDVPKTYLHLYPHAPIQMDWDVPMEYFDGATAYEVSRDRGFPCHKSQVADFMWYFQGAQKATQVEKYSPCRFGLYHTTVGADVQGNDFFENLEYVYETTPPVEAPDPTAPIPAESTAPLFVPRKVPPTPGQAELAWPLIPAAGALSLAIFAAHHGRKRENGDREN